MSLRHDPDLLITTWVAESVGLGGPDYLSEVLAVVEHTPQRRWAQWFPGSWTVAPAKAPAVRSRMLLAAGALLLVALVAGALAVGAFRRPAFVLQGVVALPGSTDVIFVSTSDDAVWATAADGVLTIDPTTGSTIDTQVPGGVIQLTGVLARPDADLGGRLLRQPRGPPGSFDAPGHRRGRCLATPSALGGRTGCGRRAVSAGS